MPRGHLQSAPILPSPVAVQQERADGSKPDI